MSLYEVALYGNLIDDVSNEFVNVFGYTGDAGLTSPATWDLAAEEWAADILAQITPLVSDKMRYTKLTIRGLDSDPIAFDHVFVPAVVGESGGDMMPKFTAWGFQYLRASVGQRSGAKRFGPMTENLVTAGVATDVAAAALDTLAVTLSLPFSWAANPDGLTPVIVSHVGGVHANAIAGVVYKRVTTQNSRKR